MTGHWICVGGLWLVGVALAWAALQAFLSEAELAGCVFGMCLLSAVGCICLALWMEDKRRESEGEL